MSQAFMTDGSRADRVPRAGVVPGGSNLARVGGALGIAAVLVGLAIFLVACMGFQAALLFSPIPMILAIPGVVLSVIGGVVRKSPQVEDAHVVAALFLNVAAIIGSLIIIAFWRGWSVFN